MFRRKRILLALAAIGLAVLLHAQWLPLLGSFLVREEAPRKADAIFVLGGDHFGDRIVKAAELARQGFAPRVLVSGPMGIFDLYESDLSIPYAQKKGYTEVEFVALKNDCKSTTDEAELYVPEWHKQGFKTVLVVTSNFHTRRAGQIMRKVQPGVEIVMVAAPTREFDPQTWWLRRQDQKNLFMEWAKTFANWAGL